MVGPNDSTKTTLLDAIEYALSPSPYLNLSEVDFYNARTVKPIEILVTVGDIPLASPLWTDVKFGFLKRGWKPDSGLIDEPEDEECELVLTVRLRIDDSYEPQWAVVADRQPEGVWISHRDRALLGVVRLGTDVDRDLAWGRYSVLSRLTGGTDAADAVIAEAQRQLRIAAKTGDVEKLNEAARKVEAAAKRLGVRPASGYQPGLDSKLVTFRQGAFALHDGDVPLRAAGLGTRRLAALATQRAAVPEGAIVLIDEVEHGLEPHRIRRLLRNLRQGLQATGEPAADPRLGQVVMTTHSAVPLLELQRDDVRVVRSVAGRTDVLCPAEEAQGVLRTVPSAFLARKVLLCEGATEVGLCRQVAEHWKSTHDGVPVEQFGVDIADGGGSSARNSAIALADLKYDVAYLGDSDRATPADITKMTSKGVKVVLWDDRLCTEERLARDLPDDGFQRLLKLACTARGPESVARAVAAALKTDRIPQNPNQTESWTISGVTMSDLRRSFGQAAKGTSNRRGWFKSVDGGRALGKVVADYLVAVATTDLGKKLKDMENWCYDGGTG
jgi:hypothetical protein